MKKLRLALLCALAMTTTLSGAEDAWLDDWQVENGFSLSIDTDGYHLPTAIAFVPNPGPGPKDPLYFVTEVRGTIKVVTNDRSVHVFAKDFFDLTVAAELPEPEGEAGMAGICLEPENGYVFVTFTYQDGNGVLRSNVMRFTSTPGTFSLQPTDSVKFSEIFADQPAAVSHMIGPCVARGGALFVAVGDARNPAASQDLDKTVGKILRMTYDGDPLPDNPFYVDGDRTKARNYVWVSGVRNTFGLAFAGDQLFGADNGPNVDRFIRIERGRNYGYDGSNWSIGVYADLVFSPAVSPVQMTYVSTSDSVVPPEYRSSFFVTFSGFVGAKPGPGTKGDKSVVRIPYDPVSGRVTGPAQPFVQYRGKGRQLPVGLAQGPDGLYFVPLLPMSGGRSAVVRVSHEPTQGHRWLLGSDPIALMDEKGCLGCHSYDPYQKRPGPTFERENLVARLQTKLFSARYLDSLDEIDKLEAEPFVSYRQARQEVRDAKGMDRLHTWIKYQIIEPKFDNPSSAMANMGVTPSEAEMIARHLLAEESELTFSDQIRFQIMRVIPKPRLRHLGVFFVGGVVCGGLFMWGFGAWVRRRRRRPRGGGDRHASAPTRPEVPSRVPVGASTGDSETFPPEGDQ